MVFVLLGTQLVGCDPCGGLETSPPSLATPSDQAEAILSVRSSALRDGLVASSLGGPDRGVRRILQGSPKAGERLWMVTAGRSPGVLTLQPEACSACASLALQLPLSLARGRAPARQGSFAQVGGTYAQVAIPVRLDIGPSMEQPGWWDLSLKSRPDEPPEVVVDAPLGSAREPELQRRLTELAREVATAEASLVVRRSRILRLRPWTSPEPLLRIGAAEVRVMGGRIDLYLRPSADLPGPGLQQLAPVEVLGKAVRLEVSPALVAALAAAEDRAGSTEQAGPHHLTLRGARVEDRRIKLGFRGVDPDRCGWFEAEAEFGPRAGAGGPSLEPLDGPVRQLASGGATRQLSAKSLDAAAQQVGLRALSSFNSVILADARGRLARPLITAPSRSTLLFAGNFQGRLRGDPAPSPVQVSPPKPQPLPPRLR